MQSTFRMVQPHQSRVMLMENCNENDTSLPTTTNAVLHSVLIAVWAKPRILEGLSAHRQSSRGRKVVPGGPTYHKNQEFSSHAHTRVVVQGGINKQIRWYILWFSAREPSSSLAEHVRFVWILQDAPTCPGGRTAFHRQSPLAGPRGWKNS